jgi:hypothetical protein
MIQDFLQEIFCSYNQFLVEFSQSDMRGKEAGQDTKVSQKETSVQEILQSIHLERYIFYLAK